MSTVPGNRVLGVRLLPQLLVLESSSLHLQSILFNVTVAAAARFVRPEGLGFALLPNCYSTQSITTQWECVLAPRPFANSRWLNQLPTDRISLNNPVLLYWPKSVPQSSSLSLKLRITVGVGNKALFKVTRSCLTWARAKVMERVEESNKL